MPRRPSVLMCKKKKRGVKYLRSPMPCVAATKRRCGSATNARFCATRHLKPSMAYFFGGPRICSCAGTRAAESSSPNSPRFRMKRDERGLRSNMPLSDTFSVSTNNEYCHCGFFAGLYHCCMNRRGFAVLVLLVLGVVPFVTNAQVNIAQGEDVRCSIECAVAARNGNPCPGTVITCKVAIPGSNTVWGICMLSGCKGQTYTGLGGGSTGVGDIGGVVGQIFKGLLDQIMQPQPASGG